MRHARDPSSKLCHACGKRFVGYDPDHCPTCGGFGWGPSNDDIPRDELELAESIAWVRDVSAAFDAAPRIDGRDSEDVLAEIGAARVTPAQLHAIRRARLRCYVPAGSDVEPHAYGSGYTTIDAGEHRRDAHPSRRRRRG